jgi:hypothetical protein
MLARIGLVGTIGLSFFYISYFSKLRYYMQYNIEKDTIIQSIFIGIMIFILYLVLAGNPLFLFPPWAFLPLMFPLIEAKRLRR